MGFIGKFFEEWEDDKRIFEVAKLTSCLFVLTILNWISVNASGFKAQADIYFQMVIVASVIGCLDFFFEKTRLLGFVFAGKNWQTALTAFGIGCVIAFIFSTTYSILPFNTLPSTGQLLFGVSSAFFFVVIIAPWVEELFFRMTIFPSLRQFLINLKINMDIASIGAVILVSGLFAFYHFAVFNGNPSVMMTAFVFSVVAILLNYTCKSSMAGYGLHLVNNYFAFKALGVL